MKDYEVLEKISTKYGINLGGFDQYAKREAILPKNRLYCKNCREVTIFAIAAIYLNERKTKKGFVTRCHKCGKIATCSEESFMPKKEVKSFYFDNSTERTKRFIMKHDGLAEEDIDAICDIYREDWQKEDIKRKREYENARLKRLASYEEEDRKKEAKTWKERLDKGEIIYVAKQRAFIEVKTGKVLRKL